MFLLFSNLLCNFLRAEEKEISQKLTYGFVDNWSWNWDMHWHMNLRNENKTIVVYHVMISFQYIFVVIFTLISLKYYR